MADVTQGVDMVQLGHSSEGGIRADGLQNVFTGMGTTRDKTTRTTVKPVSFMGHEDLEGLYAHWLMRRIVDLVADESTREGFEILFGGEGVNAETLSGVEQAIEDLEILSGFNEAARLHDCMAAAHCCFTSMMVVRLTCPLIAVTFVP